ncbi:hypothetical protein I3760_15G114700 [Carya illinoinensis]|uniref:uncharacterized protein LOC122296374 isoform X1 n=1 Tax=Carya illinoinensis TaxID=32201 RepID=UPI001BF99CC8|nr:uncharacterized protein LOC122296374 isoform X1 [Carya illinoinensis]KAG2667426.1 hypothetical protein I3760_15G114700 [Carya illinoinensis]
MQCSKEEALLRLFYNVSSCFQLLFLFFYFSILLLPKLFHFLGSNAFLQRNQNGYEYYIFSEDEELQEDEEEEEERRAHVECSDEKDHDLAADTVRGGESLLFFPNNHPTQSYQSFSEEFVSICESINGDSDPDHEDHSTPETLSSVHAFPGGSDSENGVEDVSVEEILTRDADSFRHSAQNQTMPITIEYLKRSDFVDDYKNSYVAEDLCKEENANNKPAETNFSADERFLIFVPPKLETNKFLARGKELVDDDDEIYGDSCTVGSTSKSSSEWRSSINYRDSVSTDQDPFSSSSRRSCPKWESYTVFQKYDEEMMFLDKISAQKLHETESLRSIQVCPRSMSERMVHKFATINEKPPTDLRQNPYRELEAAYVAQICLTWEALNWNYKNFQQKRASRSDLDMGCPAHVAQEFQQFQVLLQRYIENEPYEQGRRPEVYARMRLLAPKLLLVPEYRDSEDNKKQDGFGSRVSSGAFLMIMEDGIRTFMNFLKADKKKPCQIISAFFSRNRRGSVDPTLLHLIKKVNKKKKTKLKDLRRGRKCLRRRKLSVDEEMEILMGQIDLKVVSRVLRMCDISEEQMHWCEEKMSRVRVLEGKLQRDSLPLFFPAH